MKRNYSYETEISYKYAYIAIENYGFKLESSYKIDTDLKEIFKK